MAHDRKQIEQLARTYTDAWCSRDPARVAAHYTPGGMIAINGGDAAGMADVAEAFIAGGHYDQAEYDRQLQHGIGPTI
jgi:nuclear transport factor 2 (NTF2) superfamily protein